MKLKGQKGAITIYIIITISILMVLACILVDGARIRAGEVEVRNAVSNASKSVLAGYNSTLKNKFGFFVLNNNNSSEIANEMKEYMTAELMSEKDNGSKVVDIYDFKIEELKVTPIYNLSENAVVKNQILEYMKYRAPKQAIEAFWDKLKAVSDTGKAAEISKLKVEIDKLYLDIIKDQNDLVDLLKTSNEFNYSTFEKYVNSCLKAVAKFRGGEIKINKKEKELKNLIDQPPFKGKDKLIKKVKYEISKLKVEQKLPKENMRGCFKNLETYVKKYLELTSKMDTSIKRLNKNLIEIREEIRTFKKLVNKNISSSSSDYLKDLGAGFTSKDSKSRLSIYKIENSLPNEADIASLGINIQGNKDLLNKFSQDLKEFKKEYTDTVGWEENEVDVSKYLLPETQKLKFYKNNLSIGKKLQQISITTTDKDTRSNAKNEASNLIKPEKEKTNLIKQNIKLLPSYMSKNKYVNKVISADFLKEDEKYKVEYETSYLSTRASDKQSIDGGFEDSLAENLNKEVNFKNNVFFTKSFDFIINLGKALGELAVSGLVNCRDQIYIDEYIMGTFSNAVPVLRDGTNTSVDLRCNTKTKTVNNEVEYILCGSTSDSGNLNIIKGKILLIRFAVDTINIYKDPKKVEAAITIATASSSWWSFGLATPVVYNLILCGWGMTDAAIDVIHIMKGEGVPIFTKYGTAASKTNLNFTYHDYLRIFLLLENTDKKLDRIEDMVQLKSGKKLSGYNANLRIEATVSMKYLFMTEAFIPKRFKIADGSRHKFKVVLYQGY